MKKEEEMVGFDLSVLTLEELVNVYQNINDFIDYLKENELEIVEKENEDNE